MKECMNCQNRRPACQDNCELARKDRAERAGRKEMIKKAKAREGLATDTVIKLSENRRRKYAK